jgi:cardiolipin hydrolase
LPELLAQLDATLADARLSDDERRVLVHTLREASPPEDGLRQLRNRAFDLVRARTADPEQLSLLKWLEGVVRAIDTGRSPDSTAVRSQAFFSPGTACLQAIKQQLRAAKRSIDLCVFTLSDDRITAEVLAAHRRGVSLRCISDNDKEFDPAATSASCAPPAFRSRWTAPTRTCTTSSPSSTACGCSTAATTGRAAPASSTKRTWC